MITPRLVQAMERVEIVNGAILAEGGSKVPLAMAESFAVVRETLDAVVEATEDLETVYDALLNRLAMQTRATLLLIGMAAHFDLDAADEELVEMALAVNGACLTTLLAVVSEEVASHDPA